MSAIGLVGRSQVPQSHIFKIMGGGPIDFFGSEILVKSDF